MRLNLFALIASLLAVLMLGTVAAFLLFVPVMTVSAVSTVVLGSLLMFVLGLQAGRRRIRITRHKVSPASVLSTWSTVDRVG